METRIVRTDATNPDQEALAEAGGVLRAGGLVVMPTETVYGVAADALDPAAVRALRMAKGRPDEKPLPVMVRGLEDARSLAHLPPAAEALAEAFWPGPLTLVAPAGGQVGDAIHAGTGKVGLRAPDHAVAQGILAAAGRPLALTSANRSGEPDTTDGEAALRALDGRVDLVVDAGETALGRPSTVLDLTVDPPAILREGGIAAEQIRAVLRGSA